MNVPRLRFSEFSEAWEKCKLKDLYDIKNGLNKEKEYFGYGIKILNYMDVNKRVCNEENNIFGLVEVNTIEKDRFSVRNNDLFFTRTSETSNEIGLTSVYKGNNIDLVFSGFILRARPKKKVESLFYAYYLRNRKMRKEIIKHSSITTRALTSGTLLYELLLSSPQVEEQQKIGDFFMLLDKRIEQQEQKIALLKDYKKAMMQRIFSQKIRFKDQNGNDYPDWEEKKLGEMIYRSSKKNTDQKYDRIQSISNKYGFVNQEDYFQDRRVGSLNVSNYYVINKGCFAYNPSRIDVGSLAYKHDNDISIISPLYVSFKGNTKHINDKFLLGWLFSHKFVGKLGRLFEGSVRNTLSYENLSTIDIETPCIAEQEKIALFLEVINDSIENQKELLDEIIKEKTALLNRMFI